MALTDIASTDIAMLTDLYELTMAQGLWESSRPMSKVVLRRLRDHPFGSAASCAAPPNCPSLSRTCAPRQDIDI
ncbi:MAG: hypothetical protein ACLU0O_01845 [Collinsella sp.]